MNPELSPDYMDDAQTLLKVPLHEFDIVLADPPYSVEDAVRYQTSMVKRNLIMRALGAGCRPDTLVVWLDQVAPMYRKVEWALEGNIGIQRSTNHRFRLATIYRRRHSHETELGDGIGSEEETTAIQP